MFCNVSIRFSRSTLKDYQYLASLKNLIVLDALSTVMAALFTNYSYAKKQLAMNTSNTLTTTITASITLSFVTLKKSSIPFADALITSSTIKSRVRIIFRYSID